MLLYSIISMLVFCCTNNYKQTNWAMEMDNINVNVLDHLIQDGIMNITLEINNKDSIEYYMICSYKGDLDNRDFPIIERTANRLSVNYKPFYSEKVNNYYLKHENDDPIVIPGDEIGYQKIKPKEKRVITLTFSINHSNIDMLDLVLYFGEYLEKGQLSDEQTFYIPPTKELYNLFSFRKKIIKIQ